MKLKIFLISLLITSTLTKLKAQTVLVPGDLAIILVNTDNPDEVRVVVLTTIASGTVIRLTDNGWLSTGVFRGGEGTDVFTFTSGAACGDIIAIPSSSMSLSASGDQIIIYQGTSASPSMITALNIEGPSVWQTNATSSNTSALPAGLTNGTNAIAVAEVDNSIYTGSTTGTLSSLKMSLFTASNYGGSNSIRQSFSGSFSVTGGCALPVDLISFSAEMSNNIVSLNWSTASELNNHYFDILKSTDGTLFFSIGRDEGHGTSHSIQVYSFVDYDYHRPAFYKLKQVDFDDQYEYSDVVKVNDNASSADVLKQTSNKFSIEPHIETRRIIRNKVGQIITDKVFMDKASIHKSDYGLGLFIIHAINQGEIQTLKWVNAK